MEDFIYIIALIAWVIFAFYRKSQKKADTARKAEPRQRPVEQTRPFPTLEDILMGKPLEAEEEEYEEPVADEPVLSDGMSPVLKETAFEREYKLRGITSIEELVNATEGKGPITVKVLDEDQKEEYGDDWRKDFDLRQAVVYAEILNRPYA